MIFKKDFGSFIKDTGLPKNGKIVITDSFVPLDLILYPDHTSSITANINGMVASFNFNDEVLKVFIYIFQEFKLINKLALTEQIQKQTNQPVVVNFSDSPILLRIEGVALTCKLGDPEKSSKTDENFIPLVITEVKIVKEPVGVFVSSLGEVV
ncbi:MAG: hypothetical protein WC735_02740 [Candidatus Paceibacterota bacterium]|jgi:hypothetical protein